MFEGQNQNFSRGSMTPTGASSVKVEELKREKGKNDRTRREREREREEKLGGAVTQRMVQSIIFIRNLIPSIC